MDAKKNQVGGNHYKDIPIQPLEFCQINKLPACESKAIKYICRHTKKNGAEDVKKAIHCLEFLLQVDYGVSPKMTLDDYQISAQETTVYPVLGHPIVYPALGLAGEAGEVAEKVKKLMRDADGVMSDGFKKAICKELGDVLWYVSETARQAGLDLEDVAAINIAKLQARKENNTIHGEGDDREIKQSEKGVSGVPISIPYGPADAQCLHREGGCECGNEYRVNTWFADKINKATNDFAGQVCGGNSQDGSSRDIGCDCL